MAYNFQTGNNKIKLLTEYENPTQKVLFRNAVLTALMSRKKYDVIPQNGDCSRVRISVFRNEVRYQNAKPLRNSIPSDNATRRWFRQFQEAGSVLRPKGVGRPSTSQEDVDEIQETWTSYVPRRARILKLFSIMQHLFYKQ
jgi:hypothetical protein